jgi:hypothetical protein
MIDSAFDGVLTVYISEASSCTCNAYALILSCQSSLFALERDVYIPLLPTEKADAIVKLYIVVCVGSISCRSEFGTVDPSIGALMHHNIDK